MIKIKRLQKNVDRPVTLLQAWNKNGGDNSSFVNNNINLLLKKPNSKYYLESELSSMAQFFNDIVGQFGIIIPKIGHMSYFYDL